MVTVRVRVCVPFPQMSCSERIDENESESARRTEQEVKLDQAVTAQLTGQCCVLQESVCVSGLGQAAPP